MSATKRPISILVVLLVLCAVPALAMTAGGPPERVRYLRATGEVVSVDAATRSFVVERRTRAGNGERLTIYSTPDTTLAAGGERREATSLRVGESVRVTYREDGGRYVASRVTVLAPAPAGTRAAPAAAEP
ncbi:MAG TPA: hypothetical protein VF406_05890 [Thermodesulfobacteriota bacterium]